MVNRFQVATCLKSPAPFPLSKFIQGKGVRVKSPVKRALKVII
jgi:hypothetical protein